MHKFDKSTVTFDTLRNGEFILSSGSGKPFQPNFSMTDAPENWWRTSKFSNSQRFTDVDKDKYRFPRVGQYADPPSTVTLKSVSLTRKEFLDRRPRVTAPATGATAEARLWGQDKWLETPDPGPGHYDVAISTVDGGHKGCTSSFMRSKQPRFAGDPPGFLKIKHKLPPSATAHLSKRGFSLEASLARGTKYKPRSRSSRRRRPRTTGGVTFAGESSSGGFRGAPPGEGGGYGGPTPSGRRTAPSRSLWTPEEGAERGAALDPGLLEQSRLLSSSVSRLLARTRPSKTLTPAQRRAAFDQEEEHLGVLDLDVFSLRMEGKHHLVKVMMDERKKRNEKLKKSKARKRGR